MWQWAIREATKRSFSATDHIKELYQERIKELNAPEYQLLDRNQIARHLMGHHTISLFAVNPANARLQVGRD